MKVYSEELSRIGIYSRYHDIDENKLIKKDLLINYAENISVSIIKGDGRLIVGPIGCGKTTAISFIANSVFHHNFMQGEKSGLDADVFKPARYFKAIYKTFHKLKNLLFKTESQEYQELIHSNIIFIDDFNIKDDDNIEMIRMLTDFFEDIYSRKKCLIITSNKSILELKKVKNYELIIDRLRDMVKSISVNEPSKRGK